MNKTVIILLVVAAVVVVGFVVVKKTAQVSTNPTPAPVGVPRQTNLGVLTGAVNATKGLIDSISSAFTKQGASVAPQEYSSDVYDKGSPANFAWAADTTTWA